MDKLVIGLSFITLIVVLAVLFTIPTMLIMNYLIAPSAMVAVFGIAKITFWKAFWLNVLSATLFKSASK